MQTHSLCFYLFSPAHLNSHLTHLKGKRSTLINHSAENVFIDLNIDPVNHLHFLIDFADIVQAFSFRS